MATIRLDIECSVLQWAFSSCADKLDDGLTQKMYSWLAGEKKPTFTDVEKLSKKTNIPFGYFFLKEPPAEKLPLLEYRTIESAEIAEPSRELIDTISYIESVQSYMREFRQDGGYSKCAIVGSGKTMAVQELVKSVRESLDLNKEWFKNIQDVFSFLRKKFEENGVIVMKSGIAGKNTKRALNYKEFRAFTMIDAYAPLIFINSTDTKNGQVFSLMHEFVHILLGESSFYNAGVSDTSADKKNEVVCNAVTSEVLVPSDVFRAAWKQEKDMDKLAAFFHCSAIMIARKALDNNYISQNKYREICKTVIQKAEEERAKKKEESKSGNFYNTSKSRNDSQFLEAVCTGLAEGRITYTEAYRLTNTTRASLMGVVGEAWEGII